MTPEQQRIEIALAMGFKGCIDPKCDYRKAQHLHGVDGLAYFPESYSTRRYADYPNDANAMLCCARMLSHSDWRCVANMGLDGSWECFFTKGEANRTIPTKDDHYGAGDTLARALAEAFLRTIGKWRE